MLTRRELAQRSVDAVTEAAAVRRAEWIDAVMIVLQSNTGVAACSEARRRSEVYERSLQAVAAAEADLEAAVEADRGSWAYRPGMQGPGGYGTVPREFDD